MLAVEHLSWSLIAILEEVLLKYNRYKALYKLTCNFLSKIASHPSWCLLRAKSCNNETHTVMLSWHPQQFHSMLSNMHIPPFGAYPLSQSLKHTSIHAHTCTHTPLYTCCPTLTCTRDHTPALKCTRHIQTYAQKCMLLHTDTSMHISTIPFVCMFSHAHTQMPFCTLCFWHTYAQTIVSVIQQLHE